MRIFHGAARLGSRFWGRLGLAVLLAALAGAALAAPVQTAPLFRLRDSAGKPHALADYRGRPVVLFFFCGCVPCHACAELWAQAQGSESPVPVTVVVYSGDGASVNAFAHQTGLRPGPATLLTDPDDHVGALYHVSLCPRVFVLDAQGRIRYTNNAPGTNPQTMPTVTIVSQALTALRRAERAAEAHSRKPPAGAKAGKAGV
jgi:cytochrome c biogenesis protein CcmG/thiol:disulfide interchange protein DsbE